MPPTNKKRRAATTTNNKKTNTKAKKKGQPKEDNSTDNDNGFSLLKALPKEVMFPVFSFLECHEIIRVYCTCRDWYYSTELWKKLALDRHANNVLGFAFDSLKESTNSSASASDTKPKGKKGGKKQKKKKTPNRSLPEDDRSLWKTLWSSRERVLGHPPLVKGLDYDNVTEQGHPVSVQMDHPDWLKPLSNYEFAIHVWGNWGEDGIYDFKNDDITSKTKYTVKAVATINTTTTDTPSSSSSSSNVTLELHENISEFVMVWVPDEAYTEDDNQRKQIKSDATMAFVHLQTVMDWAIEISVTDLTTGLSAVLFSSKKPLINDEPFEKYGGGIDYEEYAAMPWLERNNNIGGGNGNNGMPNRYDWLPYVWIEEMGELSSVTGIGEGKAYVSFDLRWRCRRAPHNKRGDDYIEAGDNNNYGSQLMTHREASIFLKQRIAYANRQNNIQHQHPYIVHDHNAKPHCLTDASPSWPLPTRLYRPKPLSNYSFIVDVVRHVNHNIDDSGDTQQQQRHQPKKCSLFFESASQESFQKSNDMAVILDIPSSSFHLEEYLPHGDDFVVSSQVDAGERGAAAAFDIGKILTVYIMDRKTGQQAKVYESTCVWTISDNNKDERYCPSDFFAFEKCAALTQYTFLVEGGGGEETIPVPCTSCSVDKSMTGGRGRSLYLSFDLVHYNNVFDVHDFGRSNHFFRTSLSKKNTLAFLEHGLVYN